MQARVNRSPFVLSGLLSVGRLIGCLTVSAAALSAPAVERAQLVLLHGRIITVDASDSIAQALAVRDGKIIAVGNDREILRLAGPMTTRIDLHGRTATPGLIDAHAHIAEAGVAELYHVHLSDVTTVEAAVRRVREGIAGLKPGEWLQGGGWDEGKLAERRYLLASDLDKVSP
ncbi:MAG: hypothetical protein QOD56_1810, partial [Gammaproteobacteria bacterium]|nr:hypothetical protein [Gammaproteobacteria bacterium]